jgi:hypothetical protein
VKRPLGWFHNIHFDNRRAPVVRLPAFGHLLDLGQREVQHTPHPLGQLLREFPIPISQLGRSSLASRPPAATTERLTHQIADEIQRVTGSDDVFVVGRGKHL